MELNNQSKENSADKLSLNLAIVGGGRTCKFFLELLRDETFLYLKVNIVGVCDIDPTAEGLVMAKEMGIYTTNNFMDFFQIKNLDCVIELTNSKEVLLELIRLRPKRVGIFEHKISKLLRTFFMTNLQLKNAQRQMALEKMSSDFLIQQTNAAIVVLNTDFTIADANDAYLKLVKKTKEEATGAHCYEIFRGLEAPCPDLQPGAGCPFLETMKTGKSAHIIHERTDIGKQPQYCNMTTYPLKDSTGKIIRIIEICRDITEAISFKWEHREKEIKSNLNKLVQEDRMISLGKLVASCVHEINNPIQGLITFTSLMQNILQEDKPSREDMEKFKKFLSLMSNELERCGNIVSGLLSFSREPPPAKTAIDLNDILQAVISLTHHRMELQCIRLTTDLSPKPLLTMGDAGSLKQCFLNLIFNSIEAMPDGGQLQIISKGKKSDKNIRIEIHDTGFG
ncbi:MAG: PAS domain-containing protein, partial [Desulfobacterales bacterium]|nr:PAS domain-containing protein [Desulfobacterales bacterium]MDX2510166.1 PAS domain-containing protein [Desulfobacterales bacterium]